MRVAVIAGVDLKKEDGATVHVRNLLRALESAGIETSIITSENNKSKAKLIGWALKAPFQIKKGTDAVIVRFDYALPIIMLTRLRGFKTFLSLAALKQQECRPLLKPVVKTIEDLSISASNGVATISPQLKEYSEKHGAQKVLLYPLCIDYLALSKARRSRPGKNFTLGYIGTSGKWQGLDLLIAAIGLLKKENIELQVYGKISEEYLKKFEADKRIKFFGPIPNRDAPAKEKSFDLFVIPRPHHPSAETTTPIKLVEAMAAGSAILSTNVGGTTWLLKNGKNALVCEATPQAIAEAVIYAEKNPKKLEKMRHEAQRSIRSADYRTVGKKFKDFIGSV